MLLNTKHRADPNLPEDRKSGAYDRIALSGKSIRS